MPDGLTHILVDYIILHKRIKGVRLALIFAGCLIPDILLRGGRLFLIGSPNSDFNELFLTPLHTPIICLLICISISQLFHDNIRKISFLYIYLGCLTHFMLDFFQRTIEVSGFRIPRYGCYNWFFPFTFDIQCGIFWPENTPFGLIIIVPIALIIYILTSQRHFYKAL
ncbi:MAG: hypothetical protein HQK76_17130 [Desulfobacterales bacterium]|nr:hypothetical protein [Desulfobacterales bacterium]